jgi:Ca-activated chloride channel homolog
MGEHMLNRRYRIVACAVVFLSTLLWGGGGSRFAAQDSGMRLRVSVNLVQLNVAVTDSKGNYITGLRPEDFVITEDKVPQKLNTFEEGNFNPGAPGTVAAPGAGKVAGASGDDGQTLPSVSSSGVRISPLAGADVFILFDTSNYMYRGFVFAQDAISDFVRSIDEASKIAFYSYSRDLSRATLLTADRFHVVNGVRSTVAGDDAALYNSLLLTVKDAAPLTGRKAIVVFSNGPDNASSIPPEDVAELAQSTGTIIYIVSTRQAQDDLVSAAAFERMSRVTGGKAYFAGNWNKEKQAFASIRNDLGHLYALSYYPQPHPNRGWRGISVKLVGKDLQKYHIRTRDGYSLQQQTQVNSEAYLEPNTDAEPK